MAWGPLHGRRPHSHGYRERVKRTVGILGGMGPQATVDLMDKVIRSTAVVEEADHVHMLVDCNPTVPPRTTALLEGGVSPAAELVRMARGLVAAGAQVLAMPCNTAHAYREEIVAAVPVPFLDMVALAIEAAAEVAAQQPTPGGRAPAGAGPDPNALEPRAVGLLATRGTRRSRLYHQGLEAAGMRVVDLSDDEQERLDALIHHAKTQPVRPAQRLALAELIAAVADRGAGAVIAGCTEVPLLLPDEGAIPVVDPTLVLAHAIVAYCQGVEEHGGR